MIEKRALGRGLDALIPKRAISPVTSEYVNLPLNKIQPGKYQPRQEMDVKELGELSQSIKEKGFIQPIVVRKLASGNYEIVAGGRRFQAAKSLGLNEIPTIIKELDDKDTLIFAIIENLQRKDLNPLEEAQAFRRLTDEFEFTQDDLAKFLGKDKTTVVNTMRLLKLPEEIQQALQRGLISRSQARTILAMDGETAQIKLYREIIQGGLSVREIESKVRKAPGKKKVSDPYVNEAEDKLQRILGTKVRLFHKRNNRGKIVIEYYSLDDLERVMKRLS